MDMKQAKINSPKFMATVLPNIRLVAWSLLVLQMIPVFTTSFQKLI